ncbi:hypothetical protein GCM10010344_07130 [Streptomyces bluensis]|nr:hypothetical protein GCM10010344_07130 [Streptomyces bluensis]
MAPGNAVEVEARTERGLLREASWVRPQPPVTGDTGYRGGVQVVAVHRVQLEQRHRTSAAVSRPPST